MAFPTVPNSFSSGSTFIASEVNENFYAVTSGLNDGATDVYIDVASFVSGCSVTSVLSFEYMVASGIIDAVSDVTVNSAFSCGGELSIKNWGFGSSLVVSNVSGINTKIRAEQTYMRVIDNINQLAVIRAERSDGTSVPVGSMLVLEAASANITILGSGVAGIVAPDHEIRLSGANQKIISKHDKILLRLDILDGSNTYWHEISYMDNE